MCDINAISSGPGCPAGSVKDGVTCTCKAGFYGNGLLCNPCKQCDAQASTTGLCSAGTVVDTIACNCKLGFRGNGTWCRLCPAETWILNFCVGSNISAMDSNLYRGSFVEWCDTSTYEICTPNYPESRAMFLTASEGDSALLAVATSSFTPTKFELSQSLRIFLSAFRKRAAGFGIACNITAKGTSCAGPATLVAVPGLLMQTVPGDWSLTVFLPFLIVIR